MQTESDDIKLFANCLCECYTSKQKAMMMYLSSWRMVYVNVASNQKAMMMYYLSSWRIVVYVNVTHQIKKRWWCIYQVGEWFLWMLHQNKKWWWWYLSSWRIVCVNVVTHQTKSDDGTFIKLFANCLCECYMKTESDDIYQEVGELFM
jgi:hypothetical protein